MGGCHAHDCIDAHAGGVGAFFIPVIRRPGPPGLATIPFGLKVDGMGPKLTT